MTTIRETFFAPQAKLDGTHFSKNRPFSDKVIIPQSGHARRMSCIRCDLSAIIEQTRPPDPELVDLIEQAYLEGKIDSKRAEVIDSKQAEQLERKLRTDRFTLEDFRDQLRARTRWRGGFVWRRWQV